MKIRTIIIIIVGLLFIITGMVVNTVAENTKFRYEKISLPYDEYKAMVMEREVYPTVNTLIEGLEKDIEIYKDEELLNTYLKERLDIVLKSKYQIKDKLGFINLQSELSKHTRSYIDREDMKNRFYECYKIKELAKNDRYTNLLRII